MLFMLICINITGVFDFFHACCFIITLSQPAVLLVLCSEQESGTRVLTQY